MTVTLLCLPYAGAGASSFSSWRKADPVGLDVHPLQLPGRERRIAEPPFEDVHVAADAIADEVMAAKEGPFAIFGHSSGAILAYELTRRLTASGRLVGHLFVSGAPDPWCQRSERATGLGDDEFLARVERLAGYRHEAFDIPQLRDAILPTLRADVQMHDRYRPRDETPLEVGVTALRGTDDELVSAHDMAQWSAITSSELRLVELPGGHMYSQAKRS